MSMIAPFASVDLSTWKVSKTILGGAVFIAMSLPIAFPTKDLSSTLQQQVAMRGQQAATATKSVATSAKQPKAAPQIKATTAELTAKKPQPRDAANSQWMLAQR